jgi:CDP-glycerol glycerophosphotransferase (TagB/SpsB family)
MGFRFSFVPHGISKDDVSHWLGQRRFDLFVTTSPAEHHAIVDNGTPYAYTQREVRYLGLPRRDALLRLSRQATPPNTPNQRPCLLVMPTWRGGLVDDRAGVLTDAQRLAQFAQSGYAQAWRSFLNHARLQAALQAAGCQLVFMAHPNAAPYLQAFGAPAHVQLLTKADVGFMPLLCRSVALVTDYSSVAFEMGFLRRQVFYFQPDRAAFYGGDHNWRPGYFDYDRDGFGPVATSEAALVDAIEGFFAAGARPEAQYLQRMQAAMPDVDDGACARVFQTISGLSASAPSTAHDGPGQHGDLAELGFLQLAGKKPVGPPHQP